VKEFTIGQLAAEAGVPVSTVRFYERERLLVPDARTGANYRTYTKASLERLIFIRAAQASGFNLSDIREMLALTYSDAPPCDEVEALITRRLAEVKEKLRELKRIEKTLSTALRACCKRTPDWCMEIERLKGKAACDCPPKKKSAQKALTLH
jgi:DNA-binding transcriptional MerR regulator